MALFGAPLSERAAVHQRGENKRRVDLLIGLHLALGQHLNEVDVAAVLDQLGLTRPVHGQNLRPDESEQRPQLLRLGAQQLEHVGKDADG
ncbi:hypothetical protein BpHYR1_009355 [Brachionus plicatilis]|uniref:Uncharacterized protein n=1 Tax=Brachionus plicatilis TaxID=10195 RepID=A0A3M7RKQ2_BRAPC|nr:hypothetical protein BpHYR1_009355 [Brachionus plicatilis]